jgi:hypothetical protein
MEKQESKNRFPTFPQPRRLRSTFSYGIRILGASSDIIPEAQEISAVDVFPALEIGDFIPPDRQTGVPVKKVEVF